MAYIKQVKNNNYLVEKRKGKTIALKTLSKDNKEAQEQLEEYKQLVVFKKTNPMPKEKFDIIYADPPWQYTAAVENRKIENHYPTMDVMEICKLKVPAADDCILFLWGTAPKLIEAFAVIKSWGMEFKPDDKVLFTGQHILLQRLSRVPKFTVVLVYHLKGKALHELFVATAMQIYPNGKRIECTNQDIIKFVSLWFETADKGFVPSADTK